MRKQLSGVVLAEFQRTQEKGLTEAERTTEKHPSVLGELHQRAAEKKPLAPSTQKIADKGAR